MALLLSFPFHLHVLDSPKHTGTNNLRPSGGPGGTLLPPHGPQLNSSTAARSHMDQYADIFGPVLFTLYVRNLN